MLKTTSDYFHKFFNVMFFLVLFQNHLSLWKNRGTDIKIYSKCFTFASVGIKAANTGFLPLSSPSFSDQNCISKCLKLRVEELCKARSASNC